MKAKILKASAIIAVLSLALIVYDQAIADPPAAKPCTIDGDETNWTKPDASYDWTEDCPKCVEYASFVVIKDSVEYLRHMTRIENENIKLVRCEAAIPSEEPAFVSCHTISRNPEFFPPDCPQSWDELGTGGEYGGTGSGARASLRR